MFSAVILRIFVIGTISSRSRRRAPPGREAVAGSARSAPGQKPGAGASRGAADAAAVAAAGAAEPTLRFSM